jgi:predicted transcriptional regulator
MRQLRVRSSGETTRTRLESIVALLSEQQGTITIADISLANGLTYYEAAKAVDYGVRNGVLESAGVDAKDSYRRIRYRLTGRRLPGDDLGGVSFDELIAHWR